MSIFMGELKELGTVTGGEITGQVDEYGNSVGMQFKGRTFIRGLQVGDRIFKKIICGHSSMPGILAPLVGRRVRLHCYRHNLRLRAILGLQVEETDNGRTRWRTVWEGGVFKYIASMISHVVIAPFLYAIPGLLIGMALGYVVGPLLHLEAGHPHQDASKVYAAWGVMWGLIVAVFLPWSTAFSITTTWFRFRMAPKA